MRVCMDVCTVSVYVLIGGVEAVQGQQCTAVQSALAKFTFAI